jgi:hypothetical protein
MSTKELTMVVVMLLPLMVHAQGPDCDACKAVLANGVFNTTNINQTQASKDAFTAWECTTNFSDSQEAMNAGVSALVPIYDVPVQIGLKFSDDQKKTWKSSHCNNNTGDKESFSSLVVAMKQAAPEVLQAWTTCIQTSCGGPKAALACTVTSKMGGALFKANWEHTAGDVAAPKVEFFQAYDAKCSPPIRRSQTISEAGVALNCSIPVNTEAVFILQTNRGTCAPTASGRSSIETISGKQSLSGPKNYKAEKIVFSDGALLITNGYKLTFDAAEIELQGAPKIISFEPGTGAGRSAGPILIKADRLTGTSMQIVNSGEAGAAGAAGAQGTPGAPGRQGTQRDFDITGAHGGSNGTAGGPGTAGGDGSPGQAGGNGGAVIYDIGSGLRSGAIQRLDVVADGGKGGAGGAPGAGGAGGQGGAGAPGHGPAGGTDPGPDGPGGASGRVGQSGPDGANGQILDYRASQ